MKEWKIISTLPKLAETNKKQEELIATSKVVNENKEKKRVIMQAPDGRMFVVSTDKSPQPSRYGIAVGCEGKASSAEIEEAKTIVVEKLCDLIRDIAKRKPEEFFIIHETSKHPITSEMINETTVGAKFVLPHVFGDEESIG